MAKKKIETVTALEMGLSPESWPTVLKHNGDVWEKSRTVKDGEDLVAVVYRKQINDDGVELHVLNDET